MAIDIDAIRQRTWEHYQKAKDNLPLTESKTFEHYDAAISDVIPDFNADKLEFGSYDKENYSDALEVPKRAAILILLGILIIAAGFYLNDLKLCLNSST